MLLKTWSFTQRYLSTSYTSVSQAIRHNDTLDKGVWTTDHWSDFCARCVRDACKGTKILIDSYCR